MHHGSAPSLLSRLYVQAIFSLLRAGLIPGRNLGTFLISNLGQIGQWHVTRLYRPLVNLGRVLVDQGRGLQQHARRSRSLAESDDQNGS